MCSEPVIHPRHRRRCSLEGSPWCQRARNRRDRGDLSASSGVLEARSGATSPYGLAPVDSAPRSTRFYLRPVDPHAPRFFLKDGRGNILTASGATVFGAEKPSDRAVFILEALSNGAWALARDDGDRLRVRTELFLGHRLVVATFKDRATEFDLIPSEG